MTTLHFSSGLEIISWIFVAFGIISFFIILIDSIRHPQKMKIMNLVWTLNALWGSVLILWMYFSFGRIKSTDDDMMNMPMNGMEGMSDMASSAKPDSFAQQIAKSTLHCGSGCTLADIIGSFVFFAFPFTIFGSITLADWTLAYALALIIGVTFQYAALSPMQNKKSNNKTTANLWFRALKIDFFALTSWQIGMYGWMAIVIFKLYGRIPPTKIEFWFMMQLAMLAGFLCSFPINRILIKSGIKKVM